jgi:replicative DNA helicase
LLTVTKQLEKDDNLEKVGGVPYLDEMIEGVPSADNVKHYAEQVKEEAMRRQLLHAAAETYNHSFDPTEEFDTILDGLERTLIAIRAGASNGSHPDLIKDLLKDGFKHLQAVHSGEKSVIGLPTGFLDLDAMICGLHAGQYIIIAGRPSMGKSTIAQNIVQHVAIENKIPVLMFSPEMDKQMLTLRFLSALAGIPLHRVMAGGMKESDWTHVTVAASKLSEAPIYIDDTSRTSGEIRGRAYQCKAEHDIGMIVIDYIQLLKEIGKTEGRRFELNAISGNLKALGRSLNVPILILAQLNRAVENRTGNRPQLSDLRETGRLEEDADVVLLLYREQYYDRESSNTTTEVIVAKQRNGPQGVVKLGFNPAKMQFLNLDKRYS